MIGTFKIPNKYYDANIILSTYRNYDSRWSSNSEIAAWRSNMTLKSIIFLPVVGACNLVEDPINSTVSI